MWEIYDRLISGIPEDYCVEDVCCCRNYAYVKSKGNVGIAGIEFADSVGASIKHYTEGMPLRKLAEGIKSWNFVEASIGLAGINAYYNSRETATANGVELGEGSTADDRKSDPFIMMQREVRGKTVTVMRHFPYIEALFANICDLRIINPTKPVAGDYPLSAYEYFLPESDFVFLESSAVIDKSLPRMLRLCSKAQKVIMVGPSVTLCPALFEYGITELAGFVMTDQDRALRIIKGMQQGNLFSSGRKVSFAKKTD